MQPTSTPKLIVLTGLEGNPPVTLTPLQQFMEPYLPAATFFYWVLWCGILYYLVFTYLLEPTFRRSTLARHGTPAPLMGATKPRWLRYFGLIAGAGVLCGALGWIILERGPVSPQAIAGCFPRTNVQTPYTTVESCLASTIRALLNTHTTGELLKYVTASTSPAIVTQNCHEIAHVIGEETFAKAGDLQTALQQCTPACSRGCIHGVTAASVTATLGGPALTEDLVHAHLSSVKQLGTTYCEEMSSLCHGVGHVLFIGLQNIPAALNACDSVAQPSDKEVCYEGIFMEASGELLGSGASLAVMGTNTAASDMSGDMGGMDMRGPTAASTEGDGMSIASGTTTFATDIATLKNDYTYPCSVLAPQFLHACFLYLPSFQHALFKQQKVPSNEQFGLSVKACKTFLGSARSDCFEGIGFKLDTGVDSSGMAIHTGLSLCETLQNSDANSCLIGLELKYASLDEYGGAIALCHNQLNGQENVCYDAFFQTLQVGGLADADIQNICRGSVDAMECTSAFSRYLSRASTLPQYLHGEF
jgi:hypothetical protein